jgi:hopanoid-associated phosphorylase
MILAAVGMRREAALVARPGVRAVAGGGRADRLRQRLEAALGGVDAILSIGLGGALDPALTVGDAVIGSAVLSAGARWDCDAAWGARLAARLANARMATVFGSAAMVLLATDKARLRDQTGAVLVDMESQIAAEVAAAHGLPLAVLRIVSDGADRDLPRAVTAGMTADGGMNLAGVLAALARDPRQLPALIRTGRDADTAFKALGRAAQALSDELFGRL